MSRITLSRRFLLAGSGALVALGRAGRLKAAAEPMTLRLNSIAYGEHAPFALGIEKGYFAAEGIALQLIQGNGSGSTAQLVAARQDPFGYADTGTVIRAIARGVPVRTVGVFQQLSPMAVIFFAEKGYKTPKDLEGHSLALTAGDALHQLLPAFFQKNGVDADKVRLLFMDNATKSTAVVAGKADAMGGYFTTQAAQIAAVAKKPTAWLKYADFGVNTLSEGIIVHKGAQASNSDLVRRFLRAAVRSWSDAEQNPEEAAAALVKMFPESSFMAQPGQAVHQWRLHSELMRTPRAKGREPGWAAEADVQGTIDLLATFAGLSPKGRPDDYVTNSLLPA